MDLFDSPGTFGQLWDRLAGAYALDALRESEPTELTRPEVAQRFLRRVGDCIRRRAITLGLGQEFEVAGRGIVGTALTYAGRICHLAAFTRARCICGGHDGHWQPAGRCSWGCSCLTPPMRHSCACKGLLDKTEIRTKQAALHEIVREAYEDVQGHRDPVTPFASLVLLRVRSASSRCLPRVD